MMRRLLRKPELSLRAACTLAFLAWPVPAGALQDRADGAAPGSVGVDVAAPLAQRGPTSASGLSGTVLDAESGAPMARALVSAGDARVETGADGRFVLPLAPGPVVVLVTAPGYFPLTVEVVVGPEGAASLELVMIRESTVTDHVEVTAPQLHTAPPATRIVQPQDVLDTPGALDNVFRALQVLPGVAATQEAFGYLTVRGGAPDQNLTLLDGVEVHDPYRLYGLTSAFNPETIQRFDLATGGFSAKYGDRLSSLLSVESRDGTLTRQMSASAALSLTDANVVFEGAVPGVKNASWLVNARRTYYDMIANLVSDQQFPGFEDFQAKGAWAPSAGRTLTVFSLRSRQGGDLRIDDDAIDARFRDNTRNDLSWARFETAVGSSGHSMTVVSVSRTRIDTGFDGLFADKGRRSNAPGPLPARQASLQFGLGILVRDASVRHESGWVVDTHVLNAGAEVHRLSTSLDWSLLGDRNPNVSGSNIQGGAGLPDVLGSGIRSTRAGLWIEDTWALAKTASLQAGLRVDRVGATAETLLSPRLSASWSLGPSTRLRSAVGRYTQSPGYEKLAQSDYLLDLSDPAAHGVRSQQAWLASAGLERDLGSAASVRLEGYYKRFERALMGRVESDADRRARLARYDFPAHLQSDVPVDAIVTSTPTNDSTGRAYGFDVLVQRTTVSSDTRLRGWASYTWGRAERTAYGLRFPFEYDRRHAVTVLAAYQLSPRWELATTTRVASGFPRTEPLGLRVAGIADAADRDADGNRTELVPEHDSVGRPVYVVDFGGVANLHRGRLPLFARVDARATWRSSSQRWELYGEVLNVLNRRNAGVLTPRLDFDPNSDRPRLVEEPEQSLPLLPTIGLRVRF